MTDARPGARAPVVDRHRGYGWARRTVYGGGGWSGAAWRGIARPLARVWGAASARRLDARAAEADRLAAPTVAVGNVTVGGGGKTSTVAWLVGELAGLDAPVAVLLAGHGRAYDRALVLAPGIEPVDPTATGDEAPLHARAGAWVGIGRDRRAAARAVLERVRPDIFLLDDGLQHRRVARALDLVVFTAEDLAAPARCLPAGPLRQPPGWRPAQAAWIVVGGDPTRLPHRRGSIGAAFEGWWRRTPGTPADWRADPTVTLDGWRRGVDEPFEPGGRPLLALAAVARPASVARFAAETGHPVERVVAFPDHHRYRPSDVRRLVGARPDAAWLTTEKDAVKCEPGWFDEAPVGVLRRRLAPRDPGLVLDLVDEAVGGSA